MTTSQNSDFFATQIAQKGALDPQKSQQINKVKQKSPPKQDPRSLKNLLIAFNSFDIQQKGIITIEEAKKILQQKSVPIDKFDVHYKISMPNQNGFIAFDQFLFVLGLCQDTSLDVDHKYEICKKVEPRLIQFLRLLNNYRKKSETNGNYKQAKKSKTKIQQIRERQLERRKKYLGILHEHQITQLQQKQKTHFIDFCDTWDQFMMDYQKTAADLIQKLQEKHQAQLADFQSKTRQQLASKVHFSKQVIELEAKQKSLVKLQQYQKATFIKKQIQDLKCQEINRKQKLDEDSVQARCTNLKRQQLSAVNSLLQNIQKDRNDQLKQRKQDSQKLIIRNKNLIAQINHKHTQAIKKIYQALHNISLDNERVKALKKHGIVQ